MFGKKKISEKDIEKMYKHHEMMEDLIEEEEDMMEESDEKKEKEEKMMKLKAFGNAYRRMQGYKMLENYKKKK